MSESIRKVSTIFTIDDNEHNKKLKEINAQYKLTQSEVKLAGERLNQFGKNTNDLKYKQEALTKQTENLKNKINLYKDSVEKATDRAQKNSKKLEELKKTKKDLTDEYKKSAKAYEEENKKLEESQKSLEEWKQLHQEVVKEYGEGDARAQLYLRHIIENSKAIKEQSVVVEEAAKAMDEKKKALDECKDAYTEQKAVVDKNVTTVNNYKSKMNETEAQLSKVQKELKDTSDELVKQESNWIKAGESLEKAGDKISKFGEGASKVGGKLTKGVTVPVVGMGVAAVNAQVKWESAFAGVKKTVDGTEEDFKRLEEGIRDMTKELPTSAEDIAAVAESAGQLGIQTDSILGFTKTIIDLGNATNLAGEEGASQLAKFANITQMSQKDFDRLGSTIVHLGNNMATTEADIVSMAMRLAGAGKQVGLSEAEILGLASAFSSVGIEAEMGGSAISKVMVKMQASATIGSKEAQKLTEVTGMSIRELELLASNNSKAFKEVADSIGMTTKEINSIVKSANELEDFGKIAGMTGEQFKDAFEKDAATALIAFIRGLGDAESAGSSAIEMLEEMGIKEVRLRDSLLRAANAGTLLEDSIRMGNKAWEENTALTNEASQRYATTESQIKITKNEIADMAREIGVELLPTVKDILVVIKDLIGKFNELSPETKDNIIKMAALSATIGPVVGTIGKLSKGIGGTIKVASKLSSKLGELKTATTVAGTAAKVAGGSSGILSLAGGLGKVIATASPYVLAGTAIAGAGYAIYKGLSKDVVPTVDLFADKVEYTANSVTSNGDVMATGYTSSIVKISEATKKAVGAYIELDDNARNELQSLYINSTTISEEIKTDMSTKFNAMATQVIQGYERQKEESNKALQEMFANESSLTEAEQTDILVKNSTYYENKKIQTEEFEKRYNEIIDTASKERRDITKAEFDEINLLQDGMRENAIKALSDQAVEAEVILQRMKDYDTRVTAEQAGEHIKILNAKRDESIQIAEDEYNKNLAAIIRMRDESGVITDAQAKQMIEDAKRQRDGVVEQYEDIRDEAVDKIFAMNEDLKENVDYSSGEILSHWDKLKNWWNSWWPEPKHTEVFYSVKGKGGVSAQSYALGTNYFQGGLTEINERGYEMVELPRGSKIKNHLQSENMIKDTAIQTAKSILGSLDTTNGETVVNIYLDGKQLKDYTTKEVIRTINRGANNYRKSKGGLVYG